MKTHLNNKVLITGGIKRIGRAVAEKFYSAGYSLKIHYNSSFKEAGEIASDLSAEIIQCNFAEAETEDLRHLISDCNILINNASVFWTEKYHCNVSDYESTQKKINFYVPLKLMELFAQENGNRQGLIINILDASVSHHKKNPDSYYLSKYLLAEATKEYAAKLAPYIRVNGVAPGPVLPPEWASDSLMQNSIKNMMLNYPPLPADIASTCLFLAEVKSVTGEIIRVDSGWSLKSAF